MELGLTAMKQYDCVDDRMRSSSYQNTIKKCCWHCLLRRSEQRTVGQMRIVSLTRTDMKYFCAGDSRRTTAHRLLSSKFCCVGTRKKLQMRSINNSLAVVVLEKMHTLEINISSGIRRRSLVSRVGFWMAWSNLNEFSTKWQIVVVRARRTQSLRKGVLWPRPTLTLFCLYLMASLSRAKVMRSPLSLRDITLVEVQVVWPMSWLRITLSSSEPRVWSNKSTAKFMQRSDRFS